MAPPSAISWMWRFFNDLRSVAGTGTSSVSRGFLGASVVLIVLFSHISWVWRTRGLP